MEIRIADNKLLLNQPDGQQSRFHLLWLRDNCGCDQCRVTLSSERLSYTASLVGQPQVKQVNSDDNGIYVHWNDGHYSAYRHDWLQVHDYSNLARPAKPELHHWQANDTLPEYDHDDVINSETTLLNYLDDLEVYGAALLVNSPTQPGYALELAAELSIVREVAFGRIHDVLNNPEGYNVAHTSGALPPHTDLASLPYPPSGQILHYLVNEVEGGETILVDGWQVAEQLRRDDPAAFQTLCETRVEFQIFSVEHDTRSYEPIIDCYPDGSIRMIRFSNQTALPFMLPEEKMDEFYRAYQLFGRILADSSNQYQRKTQAGDLLLVNNHRVLHGRAAYNPASGHRHLQDVYVEWADLIAKKRVLRGHEPLGSWAG